MEDLLQYLIEPESLDPGIFRMINFVRYIFITLGVAMFITIIYFIVRTGMLEEKYFKDISEFTKTSAYQDIKISKNWAKIKEKVGREDESDRKLAVIEADNVLTSVLNDMGYEGETLEESLTEIGKEILPNKKELLSVHKKRRDLVYDPNYELSEEEAGEMIETYEQTLKDLQLI